MLVIPFLAPVHALSLIIICDLNHYCKCLKHKCTYYKLYRFIITISTENNSLIHSIKIPPFILSKYPVPVLLIRDRLRPRIRLLRPTRFIFEIFSNYRRIRPMELLHFRN